jgi:hypothetical protein
MDVLVITSSVMVVSATIVWRLLAPLNRPITPARVPSRASVDPPPESPPGRCR